MSGNVRHHPKWALLAAFAAMFAIVLASDWIGDLVAPLATRESTLLRANLVDGSLQGHALAALHLGAWIGLVILIEPLLLIAGLLLIERTLGYRPSGGNARLAWALRAAFYVTVYLLSLALTRWNAWLPPPLIAPSFEGVSAPVRIAGTFGMVLLVLLLLDLVQYWMHRAFHASPMLWRFHAVHHSSRDLSALHNYVHPVEAATLVLLRLFTVPLLISVDASELWLIAAFLALHTHIVHMNVPVHFGRFREVIADNRFHFLHHSRRPEDFDCNFAAMFPLLDRAFGTYRNPEGERLCETGLDDRLAPATLRDYLTARLPPSAPDLPLKAPRHPSSIRNPEGLGQLP